MALMIDMDLTLARYGSAGGQVVARCPACLKAVTVLASMVKITGCPDCGGENQPSFPLPSPTKDFRNNCVRRLYGRFAIAERTTGFEWPRNQNLLKWLGFTGDELANHIADSITTGCFYCRRELPGFFHVAHVEPIADVENVLALWQTFQLHNIVVAHAECNLRQPRKGP